ncbi:hypothetical protein AVEN_135167-1 [Araneus ventricosus]|uniref:Uncharacterized protein n=1 Tax=Araneus ventricosus TaxID=182803 RepID=A0A4Y2KKF4_ARAVE|nr:hypothetical protein AVEN_135167-1 [Araneus ventricosus]
MTLAPLNLKQPTNQKIEILTCLEVFRLPVAKWQRLGFRTGGTQVSDCVLPNFHCVLGSWGKLNLSRVEPPLAGLVWKFEEGLLCLELTSSSGRSSCKSIIVKAESEPLEGFEWLLIDVILTLCLWAKYSGPKKSGL